MLPVQDKDARQGLIMAPTTVLSWDPCPLALLDILGVAHFFWFLFRFHGFAKDDHSAPRRLSCL